MNHFPHAGAHARSVGVGISRVDMGAWPPQNGSMRLLLALWILLNSLAWPGLSRVDASGGPSPSGCACVSMIAEGPCCPLCEGGCACEGDDSPEARLPNPSVPPDRRDRPIAEIPVEREPWRDVAVLDVPSPGSTRAWYGGHASPRERRTHLCVRVV